MHIIAGKGHRLYSPHLFDHGMLSVKLGLKPLAPSPNGLSLFIEHGTAQFYCNFLGSAGKPYFTIENDSKPQDINEIKTELLWLEGVLGIPPSCHSFTPPMPGTMLSYRVQSKKKSLVQNLWTGLTFKIWLLSWPRHELFYIRQIT